MTAPEAPASRALTRDVIAQLGGRVFNLLLGIVVTALIVRTLGEGRFGQWATLLVIVQISTSFAEFGMEGVAVRLGAAQPGRRDQWVGALAAIRGVLSLPVTLISVIVVVAVSSTGEMRAAGLILCSTLLLSAPSALRAVFQIRIRNDVPVAVQTLNSLLWGAAVIALAAGDAKLVPFALAFTVVGVVTTGVQVVVAYRMASVPLRTPPGMWRELLRVGVPIGIGGLLILAYGRIDQIIVFEVAGEEEAGYYGAAYRIFDQAQIVPVSLINTLAPISAAAAAFDPERLRRIVALTAEYLTFASLAGLALALAVADPLVELLFGASLLPAADALVALSAAFVFVCLGYLAGTLVIVFDLQKRFLAMAVAGLVVNVTLNLLLVPEYGFRAAAWLTLVTEAVVVVPTLAMGLRRLEGRLPAGPYVRALAAAAVLWAAAEGLDRLGVPVLAVLVAAGPLYVALLLLTRALDGERLRALLRREDAA